MGQQAGISLCIVHHIPSQSDRWSNKPKALIFHFLFFVSLWFLLWHRKWNLSRYSEERKFCQGYQHFRLPERRTCKICFAQLDLRLPSSPPIRHILFSYCVYMHHGREEGYFGKHILQENVVWESNLIPDIAGVNYLAGHQGRTKLELLEGLPVFVDDFYVYGQLPESPNCVGARSSFVHPRRGGLETSGARRAGAKASRSATPSIKRPSTALWWWRWRK